MIFRMQKWIHFSPLCRNYIYAPLPVLASAVTRTGPVKTDGTEPQTQSPLITCLINTMGRRTSSGVCSNGPHVLDSSKQHAPFGHKPAHFTVCHAPGQTAQHQFMLNNSREETHHSQRLFLYGLKMHFLSSRTVLHTLTGKSLNIMTWLFTLRRYWPTSSTVWTTSQWIKSFGFFPTRSPGWPAKSTSFLRTGKLPSGQVIEPFIVLPEPTWREELRMQRGTTKRR